MSERTDKPIPDSMNEEEIAEYVSTLSPAELDAYIDYMISTNKDVVEEARVRDSEIIAEMRREGKLDDIYDEDELESPNDDVIALPKQTAAPTRKQPANPTRKQPARKRIPTAATAGMREFELTEEERSKIAQIDKQKKHSHVMLYIAIGCIVFLILLMIAAKILLGPSVTVSIR